jgi:DNA-binding CsgD family transcriptional regulator
VGRAYHRWTPADDEELERLWASGVRDDQRLASALDVTEHGVRKHRHDVGLVHYRRQPCTDRDDSQLLELAAEGYTSADIASRLDDKRSASSVRARLAKIRATVPTDGPPIVLVGCTVHKRRGRWPAEQLYLGRIFGAALGYARTLVEDPQIRVLSARHGLVALSTEIDWYDERLTGARRRRRWAVQVSTGIAELAPCRIVVLAGRAYVAPWQGLVAAEVVEPLAGLASGPRYARLVELARVGQRGGTG